MNNENLELASSVYESICSVLDEMSINYEKIEKDLVVLFGHHGDDMNHKLLVAVNARQEAIQLMETLPFDINPERGTDIAVATCYVNNKILSGKFTYDMDETLNFEVTQIYSGSLIGEETIKRMILALVFTVEEYDDKFFALNKGYIKTDAFK